MGDLLEGTNKCSFCNKEHEYCFDIEFTITNKFGDEEKEGKIGCYDCLRKGEFEFWHDSEFGMLDENGLTKVYSQSVENTPKLEDKTLIELKRTPQIVTNQQEIWLTHCNDFMIYKGTWEPLDFYKNSANGMGGITARRTDIAKSCVDIGTVINSSKKSCW
jgi:uncharacterized protein CbrC (UPF0167 family)